MQILYTPHKKNFFFTPEKLLITFFKMSTTTDNSLYQYY